MTPTFAEATLNTMTQATPSIVLQALPIVGMACVFYFLILRPQIHTQKEMQNLLSALQKGDVVCTNGGIIGKITKIHENFCQIEIASDCLIYVKKESIVDLVPKSSTK